MARVAATSAGALLDGIRGLSIAVSDPEHEHLVASLQGLLPACTALAQTFPSVRGRVAGLVYDSVEYRGYEGSSALHVVAQIADLLLEAGRSWLGAGELSSRQLERLSEEIERTVPSSLDDWLRTQLDPELAALERELGSTITDLYHQFQRPTPLAKVERMIQPFLLPPGKVVRAQPGRASQAVGPANVSVEFPDEKLAIITEANTRVEIRGERRVWVFRQVFEANGRVVAWDDLVDADVHRAGELMKQRNGSNTPRMATNAASFQRQGNRIRADLGKLAYRWHQDGRGARWSSDND